MEITRRETGEINARLILTVINYAENKERLSKYPFCKKGEFAITAQVCVGEKNEDGRYSACLTVTKEMLEKWDMTEEEMFRKAYNNSRILFPGEIKNFDEFAEISTEIRGDGTIAPEIYVLSNCLNFHGASVLFYQPDLLDDLCRSSGKTNVVLLPTGIHEMLCLPIRDKELENIEEFQALFDELNNGAENQSNIADNIVCYDSKRHILRELDGTEYTLDLEVS